jgi:ABC-type Mn2+/Zn2+ transport system ATPase subunit
VGLEERQQLLFGSLSGGQRQRVLVARALIGNPKLLILDEPTVNVDADTAMHIGRLLEKLRQDGPGMVITSHVHDWITATHEVEVQAHRQEARDV